MCQGLSQPQLRFRRYRQAEDAVTAGLQSMRQRRLYEQGASDSRRRVFRARLRDLLEDLILQYQGPVDDEQHLANLQQFQQTIQAEFADILEDGFPAGLVQKIVNLYLKNL